jgi:hypothetical protein
VLLRSSHVLFEPFCFFREPSTDLKFCHSNVHFPLLPQPNGNGYGAPPPPPPGYPTTGYAQQYPQNTAGTYNPNQQYYAQQPGATTMGGSSYPQAPYARPQQQTVYVNQQRPNNSAAGDVACCACLACLCALCLLD